MRLASHQLSSSFSKSPVSQEQGEKTRAGHPTSFCGLHECMHRAFGDGRCCETWGQGADGGRG